MGRKMIVGTPNGSWQTLDEVLAENEFQLQSQLKSHPELLPLDDLGLTGPAIVVGRESQLASGAVDLVLLTNGGELAIVEFKTGPQNPDFRHCLTQLLDYGSDLWGMSSNEFESRVFDAYRHGPHFAHVGNESASLETLASQTWGATQEDAVGWRERLQAQLRDGDFHYIAVAQRFTTSVLRTLAYLNSMSKSSRFSAVEIVRFSSDEREAFEARFVAGPEPTPGSAAPKKSLAGADEFLKRVLDNEYRHTLQDLLSALADIDGLSIVWGTTGCSLRVAIPSRSPLSIGWLFPPGPGRWLGLTDLTLGWYEDANGLALGTDAREALTTYGERIKQLPGGAEPASQTIRGRSFDQAAVSEIAGDVPTLIRESVDSVTAVTLVPTHDPSTIG